MRLMIVDTSREMRAMLRLLLSGLYDELFECRIGEEAIALCDYWQPDLVLTEVALPGLDGIETMCCSLRTNPSIRWIFVTEEDDRSCRDDALEAGAEAYFLKEHMLELREYLMEQPQQDCVRE